ncbi:hypothetical protein [Methylobacterium sp. J-076]|uniref:hypothetical protein n=1 Tax=Methylobacterium sp. J-076 TaxID=2836655 RepID=UPI001FBA85C0|nr:hypothetical protein [Methylobacterium sp. J-076]MCJ2012333.1 hypothetical protein [Methylobacterium sp. J-076]
MSHDATEARHLDLIRSADAAGTAFGCVDDDERRAAPFVTVSAAAALAVATLATTFAAAIASLI